MVKRPDGELLVAFRRAPDRRRLGEKSYSHTDPNSQLVLVRSRDEGKTWSRTPELLYAHPFGGSQDPCMVQLRDDSILCTSYGWALLNADYAASLTNAARHGSFAFLGGYILRSKDGGRSWQGPICPPHVAGDNTVDIFGQPCPPITAARCARGRMDGSIGSWWRTSLRSRDRPGRIC